MEIHETHFQEWHRLSIIRMVLRSGSTLLLPPMAFCAESRLRQPGVLAAPTPQHHSRMMRAQSWLTAWILYCILILVLSNFSKVEKSDK